MPLNIHSQNLQSLQVYEYIIYFDLYISTFNLMAFLLQQDISLHVNLKMHYLEGDDTFVNCVVGDCIDFAVYERQPVSLIL